MVKVLILGATGNLGTHVSHQAIAVGLFALSMSDDNVGEAHWEEFQKERLGTLKDAELREIANRDPLFDHDAYLVLAERRFNQHGQELRAGIEDQFKAWFAAGFQVVSGESLRERVARLEKYLRKEMTRKALDVVCRREEASDLSLVRSAVKTGFVDYSEWHLHYFRECGEWEDIPLIVETLDRPKPGARSLLLSPMDQSAYRLAASYIYELGRHRLLELIAVKMPQGLLSQLLVRIPDKAFRKIPSPSIVSLLASQDDRVRKATALKCVRVFNKKQIDKLLLDYLSINSTHYYNVFHWLDFGISVAKDTVLRATARIVETEW